ncbi:MAG: ribosome biogenesis factor YjgA [Succinivibrionaceae bacterium]
MYDTDQINEYDDWISKSQLKRESKILHALGEEISRLSESEFQRLDFEEHDTFYKEMLIARKLLNNPQFEPYRRQMLHIERLLRSLDEEFVQKLRTAVDVIKSKKIAGNAAFHRLEKLRLDLLGDNSLQIINELTAKNRSLDRNQLRTLVTKAKREKELGRSQECFRELFRFLRDNC